MPPWLRVPVLAVLLTLPGGAAGQARLAGHALGVYGPDRRSGDGTILLNVHGEAGGRIGPLEWLWDGGAWWDVGEPDASLADVRHATVAVSGSWGRLRGGVSHLPWGLSRFRSPVAAFTPDAVLWSTLSGPALSAPLAELTVFGPWGDLQAVLLPLRRPYHQGSVVTRSWDGTPLPGESAWEAGPDVGVRLWRAFRAVDVALSYLQGSDRRPWSRRRSDGSAELHHPGIRTVGWEMQWARGAAVVRSEGSATRRDGAWHTRILAGVEWFPAPWLTLLAEQGFATDRSTAPSPLLDDGLLSAELVAESLRVTGQLFLDPSGGPVHAGIGVRWLPVPSLAVELEWIAARGERGNTAPLAPRQPHILRLGGVHYF